MTAAGVHDGVEIERAISTFATRPDGGLIVVPQDITVTRRVRSLGTLLDLCRERSLRSLPTIRAADGQLILNFRLEVRQQSFKSRSIRPAPR